MTNRFTSPKTSADTFEVVSFLMNHGAVLPASSAFTPITPTPITPPTFEPPFAPPSVPEDWKKPKIFRAGQDVTPQL